MKRKETGLDKSTELRTISADIHVTGRTAMTSMTATEARANLYRLIDETANGCEPILITGKRHNAVLLAEDDWRAIQETLYLLSIPGMSESIRGGLATPVETLSGELDW